MPANRGGRACQRVGLVFELMGVPQQISQPIEILHVGCEGSHVKRCRRLMCRWGFAEPSQHRVDTRLQQWWDRAASEVAKVPRGRARLSKALCSYKPADIRDPQLERLQRQMCCARRGQAVRYMHAKRIDVAESGLYRRFTLADDRLYARRKTGSRRACPLHRSTRIRDCAGGNLEPRDDTPIPGTHVGVAARSNRFQNRSRVGVTPLPK